MLEDKIIGQKFARQNIKILQKKRQTKSVKQKLIINCEFINQVYLN